MSEATVKPTFSRYILDGNTKNYNKFGNDAYISLENTKDITTHDIPGITHFILNQNNYFFCNDIDNHIRAYTNTGILYYTTTKEYPNITCMSLNSNNDILIKYDTNKMDCLAVLGNMLNVVWSIENNDIGSKFTSNDKYIYINDINYENKIHFLKADINETTNLWVIEIVQTVDVSNFDEPYFSNINKQLKDIIYNNGYIYCLFGVSTVDNFSYIAKIDLNTYNIIYNVKVSNNYTKVTSNLYTIFNSTYYGKNNILFQMENDKIINQLVLFDDINTNIIKINRINEDQISVLTDNNKISIIDITYNTNILGKIIYNYDTGEDSNVIIDLYLKKDGNYYFIYNNKIVEKSLSLIIDSYGIIGSECYKLDGGNSYIGFKSMPMSNSEFSTCISFKPTKINNKKSVLVGGADNYDWKSICWAEHLNIFCSIANNDNISSIMVDDGSSNWYTNKTRTLPISNWNSICWDNINKLFYTISIDNKFAYSSDGLNWTLLETIPTISKWNKVFFANYINNIYILQKNSNKLLYAMDIDSVWKELTLPIVSNWKDVAYRHSDKMLLLTNGTNIIYNMKNHNIITPITIGNKFNNWTNVYYNETNNEFVLTGKNTDEIAFSKNGTNWKIIKLPYKDSWSAIIYDYFKFNKYFLFSEYNDTYLTTSNLDVGDNEKVIWKKVKGMDCAYNINDVALSDNMMCVLFNDTDLTFKPLAGTDVVVDNKYYKDTNYIFNRNITKSIFQLYFDKHDNFLYVLYGNFKFKCNFKLDSQKMDKWHNITAIFDKDIIKVYSSDKNIGNFNIFDGDIYNNNSNDIPNNKIYFINVTTNTHSNIYDFKIGGSINHSNILYQNKRELYAYVNDFILWSYPITEKEVDEISKIKILHYRFNYDFNDPIYNSMVHDISCYKHNLIGNATYSSTEEALEFNNNTNLTLIEDSKFIFNNDEFTMSFWYKNDIDAENGSKILISNYQNKKPYMVLIADQFKPRIDLPIKLVQSNYVFGDINFTLYKVKWEEIDNNFYYTIYHDSINSDTVIDILPDINIEDFEMDNLIESGMTGESQVDGSFILKCTSMPVVDINIRVITRNWIPSEMSLTYITLNKNDWHDNGLGTSNINDDLFYTITLADVKSTDTIEMIIDNTLTDEEYNIIMSADLRGYSQSDGSFVIKAFGEKPTIDITILFYVNSIINTTTNSKLDRSYWIGEEKPFNYKLELDELTTNFINILPGDNITNNELNILKTSGIRDGGTFGLDVDGWLIAYIPTEEDENIYSLYFVMLDKAKNITKFKLINTDVDYSKWNNFVISYSDGIFNTYVNGIADTVENFKNEVTGNNITIGANNNIITIVDIGTLNGKYFMKDVRLYYNKLNNNYIQELYNRGNILNSNGSLYTTKLIEGSENINISKNGLEVSSIIEYTNTDPDLIYDDELLINLNHGLNSNEVLLKDEIKEIL